MKSHLYCHFYLTSLCGGTGITSIPRWIRIHGPKTKISRCFSLRASLAIVGKKCKAYAISMTISDRPDLAPLYPGSQISRRPFRKVRMGTAGRFTAPTFSIHASTSPRLAGSSLCDACMHVVVARPPDEAPPDPAPFESDVETAMKRNEQNCAESKH